jgi:hypothetical protein
MKDTVAPLTRLPNFPKGFVAALLGAFILCACVGVVGQTRGVPYDRDRGPGFSELTLDSPYPGIYENIEAVDFRDHTLTIFDENKHSLIRAKLKDGRYEHRGKTEFDDVKLDSVYYLPSQDAERKFALVLYTWFAAVGSSNTDGIAEVYALEAHQLKLVQQFSWDEHFETDERYISFDEKSQTLTIRSGHYLPGDSHCCISAVDVVTLRWDGSRLAKRSVRVELSKYGRESGKKLYP